MIRHLSFDVWNTLVVPNPYYAKARVKALANLVHVDLEQAKEAYRQTKHIVDTNAELYGIGVSTSTVYLMLMDKLIPDQPLELRKKLASKFRAEVERLFVLMPPRVTDEAREIVKFARSRELTISIGSNSNFISGRIMHRYLEARLGELDHGVYSDLYETSKPSHRFFNHVLVNTQVLYRTRFDACLAHEILHVGDNEGCDVIGAQNMGIHGLLIPTPESLFVATKSKIEEINNA